MIKMGAEAGLTLYEIGFFGDFKFIGYKAQLIYKEDEDEKSILNDIASRAAILTKNNEMHIKECYFRKAKKIKLNKPNKNTLKINKKLSKLSNRKLSLIPE